MASEKMPQQAELESVVAAHMAEAAVPTSVYELRNDEASISVRKRGCFIADSALLDPKTDSYINIFYCEPDLAKSKLSASHIMSPVGPSDTPGGQHGFARWVDYEAMPTVNGLQLASDVPSDAPKMTKYFEIDRSALRMTSELYNATQQTMQTSLGEHAYFRLKDAETGGLTVNGKTIDELLGSNALDEIMSGRAQLWGDFGGDATITFPEGHTMRIQSSYDINTEVGEVSNLGMLLWRRPGTDSICFEPTVGFAADGYNQAIELTADSKLSLHSAIELIN